MQTLPLVLKSVKDTGLECLFIYLFALYFTTTLVALNGWMVVKVN